MPVLAQRAVATPSVLTRGGGKVGAYKTEPPEDQARKTGINKKNPKYILRTTVEGEEPRPQRVQVTRGQRSRITVARVRNTRRPYTQLSRSVAAPDLPAEHRGAEEAKQVSQPETDVETPVTTAATTINSKATTKPGGKTTKRRKPKGGRKRNNNKSKAKKRKKQKQTTASAAEES